MGRGSVTELITQSGLILDMSQRTMANFFPSGDQEMAAEPRFVESVCVSPV